MTNRTEDYIIEQLHSFEEKFNGIEFTYSICPVSMFHTIAYKNYDSQDLDFNIEQRKFLDTTRSMFHGIDIYVEEFDNFEDYTEIIYSTAKVEELILNTDIICSFNESTDIGSLKDVIKYCDSYNITNQKSHIEKFNIETLEEIYPYHQNNYQAHKNNFAFAA